jgi:transcriptional regulator with XRE-family HTH domain
MQASTVLVAHHAPRMAGDTMIHWLARAAAKLREESGRKQVHIAAAMSIDQSTIYRFEQGESWPRQADLVIAAYADDLGIEDAREVWELALQMWREEGEAPSLASLLNSGPRGPASDPAAQRRELARLREEDDAASKSRPRSGRRKRG